MPWLRALVLPIGLGPFVHHDHAGAVQFDDRADDLPFEDVASFDRACSASDSGTSSTSIDSSYFSCTTTGQRLATYEPCSGTLSKIPPAPMEHELSTGQAVTYQTASWRTSATSSRCHTLPVPSSVEVRNMKVVGSAEKIAGALLKALEANRVTCDEVLLPESGPYYSQLLFNLGSSSERL